MSDHSKFLCNIVQFFDDDIRGKVPFKDKNAHLSQKARPQHILLGVKVDKKEGRLLRQAIANDINQPEDRSNDNTRRI